MGQTPSSRSEQLLSSAGASSDHAACAPCHSAKTPAGTSGLFTQADAYLRLDDTLLTSVAEPTPQTTPRPAKELLRSESASSLVSLSTQSQCDESIVQDAKLRSASTDTPHTVLHISTPAASARSMASSVHLASATHDNEHVLRSVGALRQYRRRLQVLPAAARAVECAAPAAPAAPADHAELKAERDLETIIAYLDSLKRRKKQLHPARRSKAKTKAKPTLPPKALQFTLPAAAAVTTKATNANTPPLASARPRAGSSTRGQARSGAVHQARAFPQQEVWEAIVGELTQLDGHPSYQSFHQVQHKESVERTLLLALRLLDVMMASQDTLSFKLSPKMVLTLDNRTEAAAVYRRLAVLRIDFLDWCTFLRGVGITSRDVQRKTVGDCVVALLHPSRRFRGLKRLLKAIRADVRSVMKSGSRRFSLQHVPVGIASGLVSLARLLEAQRVVHLRAVDAQRVLLARRKKNQRRRRVR